MGCIFAVTLKSFHTQWLKFRERGRALGDESGNALVELALVSSLVFTPMLLGTVELAQVLFDSIEVSNAAHAGASWGMMNSTSANLGSGITAAAQAEASDFGTNLIVTPNVYWVCSNALGGAQYTSLSSATTACTGSSNHPLELIQVVASTSVTIPIRMPGIPASIGLSSRAVTETE